MRNREQVHVITSLPEPEKGPNYRLRRTVAGVIAGLALFGVAKGVEVSASAVGSAIDSMTESDFDSHDCSVEDGKTVVIGSGKTVWDEAASPLASELSTSVDTAMLILADANPKVDSLGNVEAGTHVTIPKCNP